MIIRATQEQVDKYYERLEVNQSSLKEILFGGMQSFLAKSQELMSEYSEKKYLIEGSGVDCILSMGRDVFEKQYHVSKIPKKPGEKAMLTLKYAYEEALNIGSGVDADITAYIKQIYDAATKAEYQMNWYKAGVKPEDDTRVKAILKDPVNSAYWNDIVSAEGKQILSDQEIYNIETISNSFLTHLHTRNLFIDGPDTDLIYQFAGFFETHNQVPAKFMTDLLIIRHKSKVINPVDFKTTRQHVTKFPIEINSWRYDIQAAFYSLGVRRCLDKISELLGKDVTDYSIGKFAFAVESTQSPGCPLIFPLNESIINRGKIGDSEYEGYESALTVYKYWQRHEFKVEKIFSSKNGVVFIDDTNIGTTINHLD